MITAEQLGSLFDDPEALDEDEEVEQPRSQPLSLYLYKKTISKIPILEPLQVRQLAEIKERGATPQGTQDILNFAKTMFRGAAKQIETPADARQIASDCLFLGHLRLAAHVARLTMGWKPFGRGDFKDNGESIFRGAIHKDLSQFASAHMPLEDRISNANFGLMDAVKNYQPDRGAKFSTYAMYWIENAIVRAIQNDGTIRVPVHIHERLAKSRKEGTLEGASLPYLEGDRYLILDDTSVNKALGTMIRGLVQLEEIADEVEAGEEELHLVAETAVREEAVRRAVEALPPREKTIIEMRFGLKDDEAHTLEEIGVALDLTRERIRQLESQALQRLKDSSLYEKIF